MKKKSTVLLLLAAVTTAWAVNVKDFGAKGDGKTDDYAAVQKAVSFLASNIKYDRFRCENGWYGGSIETYVDELYFPAGTYRITGTLVADGSVAWRGEKGTTIIQTDSNADILYCRVYRRVLMDGITFTGGRIQVNLWNRNWNASSVSIRNCTFKDSSGWALQSISRRVKQKEKGKVVMIPPYEVTFKDGLPQLKANDFSKSIACYSSNIISVRNCEFLNCMRAFNLDNDGTLIQDCRVVANPETEGEIMTIGIGLAPNMIHIWNMQAEAPASSKHQIWFKSEGFFFTCNDSEFKSAQGMLLLDQHTLKVPPTAGNISINRCRFNTAGNPAGAALEFGRTPSVFKFVDNTETSGKEVPIIKWRKLPTQSDLDKDSFAGTHGGIPWSLDNKYNFIIAGNKNINEKLPEILNRFLEPDIPELHLAPPRLKQVEDIFNGEIKASDFGVIGNGDVDNTAALEKALKAACDARKTLIIPQGIIRIKSTIVLPPYVSMRGEGMPIIQGDRLEGFDLFNAPETGDIRLRSLILRNSKKILEAKLTEKSKYICIDDCLIYDTGAVSFNIVNAPGVKNNTVQVELLGSLWNGAGAIYSEAMFTECAMNWFANNLLMDDQAFITQKNGTLVIRPGFFVPYISKGTTRKNTITGEEKVWPLGGNLRWIDNIGADVWLYDCRAGGEAGGYCTIFNREKRGRIYLEGGIGRCTSPDTKHCIFYAEQEPESAVILGTSGYPVSKLLGVEHKVFRCAPGVNGKNIRIYGNMTPQ